MSTGTVIGRPEEDGEGRTAAAAAVADNHSAPPVNQMPSFGNQNQCRSHRSLAELKLCGQSR